MDSFFELSKDFCFDQDLRTIMGYPEFFEIRTPEPVVKQSAFVRYQRPTGFSNQSVNFVFRNDGNLNKRVIKFLRRIQTSTVGNHELEANQGYRHMINERQRREKLKQSYSTLHSLLPPRSKTDKISILQMAALQVHHLQGLKKELQKQNNEIEAKLARKIERVEVSKLKLQVENPSSSIDSMMVVLRGLNDMKLKARKIQCEVSNQEFSATLEIETKIGIMGAVEKALERALMEVESSFQERSKWQSG